MSASPARLPFSRGTARPTLELHFPRSNAAIIFGRFQRPLKARNERSLNAGTMLDQEKQPLTAQASEYHGLSKQRLRTGNPRRWVGNNHPERQRYRAL